MSKTVRLVTYPVLISVAVTLLRLGGELLHWSPVWFSPATGGPIPSGWSWVVGITWLPVIFGPYFAYRLWTRGPRPTGNIRVVGLGVVGVVVVLAGMRVIAPHLTTEAPGWLVAIWAVMALGAAIQFWGWPDLARTLLAYGIGSRFVVAVVMLLAMVGSWDTHYDYVDSPALRELPLVTRYIALGLIPQLVFWVGFTIIVGSLTGGIAVLVLGRSPRDAVSR
jgi:hypothetical protein